MKIVVTGATSFIGKSFIRNAYAKGHKITAVVRDKKKIPDDLVSNISNIIELEMNNYGALGENVGSCDCFVHLSWNGTRGMQRSDEILQKSNYENSIKAVSSVINVGCKKIVLAGSQAEYGNHRGVITETTPCIPNTMYGKYKIKLYNSVMKLCEREDVSIIEPRFFSIYGPGDYKGSLIMSLIKQMEANEPCELTKCIQKWDYLYIDDAVDAVLKLCEKSTSHGIYNLGSGDVRMLRDYVEEIHRIIGSKSILNYGSISYPQTGMVSIYPSIEKTIDEIGEFAVTNFEKGIGNIINYSIC